MVLLIIIPTKWLFHWGYTPFSDIPMSWCRWAWALEGHHQLGAWNRSKSNKLEISDTTEWSNYRDSWVCSKIGYIALNLLVHEHCPVKVAIFGGLPHFCTCLPILIYPPTVLVSPNQPTYRLGIPSCRVLSLFDVDSAISMRILTSESGCYQSNQSTEKSVVPTRFHDVQ